MSISAAEAARLTGLSKQAVINAINAGKISAVKDVDGRWCIEPVELFRHYQPVSSIPVWTRTSVDTYQVEMQLLRERLRDKDDALRAASDRIADLRRHLDDESDERRRLTAVVEALTASQP